MRLLVTGGTGFLGRALCARLRESGHDLVGLTRTPSCAPAAAGIAWRGWDSGWEQEAASFDGVVNLAGESIAGARWTEGRKRALRGSRIDTTRRLVQAMSAAGPRRPGVLINASAIGYYGPRGDDLLDETAPPGAGFLAEMCRAWEDEAKRARSLGMRVVCLRIGLVLGPGGGVLAKMAPPFACFLGGPLGDGRQWVSWVHRDDLIGLIEWALGTDAAAGPVNATAPEPVTMRQFCAAVGRALRRPSWLPAPAAALRALLGEMADMLLTGQRVLPHVALGHGFSFRYPRLEEALAACLA